VAFIGRKDYRKKLAYSHYKELPPRDQAQPQIWEYLWLRMPPFIFFYSECHHFIYGFLW